ncbi:DUF302 domain-containing protein [Komagataeibacter diospyri]|uniref:DUF302 domain-containing protein n=1 Tax=Komagataeibacter diospyri TaxID=1932662 RepID=UPI0037572D36
MANINVVTKSICVEHVRIGCTRPFAEVLAAVDSSIPCLDDNLTVLLTNGDRAGVEEYEKHGPPLFVFLKRDHGALLAVTGRTGNAVQFEIGNPIMASKMTRYQPGAALYAPLRVALLELENGEVVFEYDRPSSLFGQFGDERVREVGLYLDRELETALIKAAG